MLYTRTVGSTDATQAVVTVSLLSKAGIYRNSYEKLPPWGGNYLLSYECPWPWIGRKRAMVGCTSNYFRDPWTG